MIGPEAADSQTATLASVHTSGITYGRARLLLGITGVGVWVVVASLVLVGGLPAQLLEATGSSVLANVLALCGLILGMVLIQSPLDLLGGFVLPRRHGRSSEQFGRFALRWLRGVLGYAFTAFAVGMALLIASRYAGSVGMVLAGASMSLMLLAARGLLARVIGGLSFRETSGELPRDVRVVASTDPGFTGGMCGVFHAREYWLPAAWIDGLAAEELQLALRRRREAVTSGLWLRGRMSALAFVWMGLVAASTQVGELAGTTGGVVVFASVFTLWSFVGLLVLPTLSRRASLAVDHRLRAEGVDSEALRALAAQLDAMQDNEPSRAAWIEAIFHPIPNVTSRQPTLRSARLAAWDVARTAAFLGLAGLSPLGRAVHCNAGRPSLWVFLPLD